MSNLNKRVERLEEKANPPRVFIFCQDIFDPDIFFYEGEKYTEAEAAAMPGPDDNVTWIYWRSDPQKAREAA